MDKRLIDLDGRRKRIVEQARLEKAALADLDRAETRLETATEHYGKAVAQAEAAVTEARRAHEHALALFVRCAGLERAARFLGFDERELRRLVKEVAL